MNRPSKRRVHVGWGEEVMYAAQVMLRLRRSDVLNRRGDSRIARLYMFFLFDRGGSM